MTDARALAELRTDDAAWDAWVEQAAAGSHLQLSGWAKVKAETGWRAVRVVADGGSGIIGAQVLVRRLGPGPFAIGYAPRGPLATRLDGPSLAAFGEALRRMARRERLSHVTADPGLPAEAAESVLREAGWRQADPIQHDRTRVVDLDVGEDVLWSGLRSSARWSVNRARRDGVTIERGGEELLPAFYDLLVETATRSGFIHRDRASYGASLRAFAAPERSWILLARLAGGEPGAALLLVRCGERVAEPYAGMSTAGAKARANYLLKWEAMRAAAADGARLYDMWGLAHAGIAEFKQGFGGREVAFCGTWDLVTLPLLREGVVRARRGWVRLARRRRGLASPPVGAPAS